MNDTLVFKFRRNPQLIMLYHICLFVADFSFFILYFNKNNYVFIFLLIGTIITHIFILIFSNYTGLNSMIYFGKEQIWQKIKGKVYVWAWEDFEFCDFKIPKFLGSILLYVPPIVRLSSRENKKLTFAYSISREKLFLKLCPNEKIKELFINGKWH